MAGRPKKTLNKKDAEKITELASTRIFGIWIYAVVWGFHGMYLIENLNNKSYISDAMQKGEALGRKAIVNSLYQNALNGAFPSQIFWLKNGKENGKTNQRLK